MPHSPWSLRERQARLDLGSFSAQLDVDQPRLGLGSIASSGEPFAKLALYQIGIEPRIDNPVAGGSDVYVRGNDLIATYERTEARPLRFQLFWRALSATQPASAAGVELVVSVQTHLLDSDPKLTITSTIPATDVRRLCAADGSHFVTVAADARTGSSDISTPPSCILFRISPTASYVEMLHPTDCRQVTISSLAGSAANMFSLQTRLFVERLEKGVILRSRMRSYLLPRAADEATAAQLYREFAIAEPPLTA